MDMFGDHWTNHAKRIRASWTRIVGEGDSVLVLFLLDRSFKPENVMMKKIFDTLPRTPRRSERGTSGPGFRFSGGIRFQMSGFSDGCGM